MRQWYGKNARWWEFETLLLLEPHTAPWGRRGSFRRKQECQFYVIQCKISYGSLVYLIETAGNLLSQNQDIWLLLKLQFYDQESLGYIKVLWFKNSMTKSNLTLINQNSCWGILKERNVVVTYSCTQHKLYINTTQGMLFMIQTSWSASEVISKHSDCF